LVGAITLFHPVRSHSPEQRVTLSTAIPLSSIIKEMPQNYNSYIQASRDKAGIHGRQVRNCLSKKPMNGDGPPNPHRLMIFSKMSAGAFCHSRLSALLVTPGCRLSLSL